MKRKQGAGRAQVLIIEDHPASRRGLREWFERRGFDTLDAGEGQTARNQLAEHCPDLICLDLVLPEGSGYELCEQIRRSARHRGTPVLVMSSQVLPTDRAHAFECGADAFLAKPFSEEQLQTQVESLLQLAEARREDATATPVPAPSRVGASADEPVQHLQSVNSSF